MKKLGILGGTFDPIHNGHLYLAREAYSKLGLDEVLLVPASVPPHKLGLDVTPARDRYMMTLLATEGESFMRVSDIELKREGPSYTYDTVLALKKLYPDYEFYFIIGGDTVPQLHTWSRIRVLLEMVTFVAVGRPGYTDVINQAANELGDIVYQKVKMLDTREFSVSSTEIRNRIRQRRSLIGLVPDIVQEYIYVNGLYHTNSVTQKHRDDGTIDLEDF